MRLLHIVRILVAALAAGASLSGVRAQQDPPPQRDQQPIRTEATFVRVDVYPTRDGRPVQGLTAEDFEIREDGVLQRIQSFEHVVVPTGPGAGAITDPGSQREMLQAAANPRARLVVVFLDIPHVGIAGSHAIKEPLIDLVNRVLGPDDLVGLMTPEMSASQVVLGRKTRVIEELLRRNWDWGQASDNIPRLTEREIKYTLCYPELQYGPLAGLMIAKSRERATLEAMQDLVNYLGAIREERKAIVAVSQGWRLMGETPDMMNLGKGEEVPGREPITVGPTGQPVLVDPRKGAGGVSKAECDEDRMRLAQMDNERFFQDLLGDANRANASFYPVDPSGLRAPSGGAPYNPSPRERTRELDVITGSIDHLRELAQNTDGIAIVDTNDLDRGVRRVADDLTSYYLLGYNSTNAKLDGRYRRIQVRVKQPGIDVRARRGYRAATPAELSAPARTGSSVPKPLTDAMSALSRVRAESPFQINVATYVEENGEATIWIAGELVPGRTDEFSAGATADMEVQAGDRSTTAHVVLEPGERGFITAVKLAAEDATEVNVRARVTGQGSMEPATDTLRTEIGPGVARPLIFRRGPSTANRMMPTAGAVFTRADRIRLELPVAPDTKPGTARMLDRAGNPLGVPVRVGEKIDDASGHHWITADVALAPLAAGDYAIEQAPDGMRKVITAIRVTR